MTSFSALDAKNRFGEVLTAAQHEPVTIEKHGKPVAVVISKAAYDEFRAAKLEMLRAEVQRGVADLEAGRVVDGEEGFRQLLDRLK